MRERRVEGGYWDDRPIHDGQPLVGYHYPGLAKTVSRHFTNQIALRVGADPLERLLNQVSDIGNMDGVALSIDNQSTSKSICVFGVMPALTTTNLKMNEALGQTDAIFRQAYINFLIRVNSLISGGVENYFSYRSYSIDSTGFTDKDYVAEAMRMSGLKYASPETGELAWQKDVFIIRNRKKFKILPN